MKKTIIIIGMLLMVSLVLATEFTENEVKLLTDNQIDNYINRSLNNINYGQSCYVERESMKVECLIDIPTLQEEHYNLYSIWMLPMEFSFPVSHWTLCRGFNYTKQQCFNNLFERQDTYNYTLPSNETINIRPIAYQVKNSMEIQASIAKEMRDNLLSPAISEIEEFI